LMCPSLTSPGGSGREGDPHLHPRRERREEGGGRAEFGDIGFVDGGLASTDLADEGRLVSQPVVGVFGGEVGFREIVAGDMGSDCRR